jgi:hypothetical protein
MAAEQNITSRRRFLTGTAALAAGAAAAAPAMAAGDAAEAELLALHDEVLRLAEEAARFQTEIIDDLHPVWVDMARKDGFRGKGTPAARFYEESGLSAAMTAQRVLDERADDISQRIRRSPLTTPRALAMKASVIKRHSASHFWQETDSDADWDHLITGQLLDEVIAAGGLATS